MKIGHITMSLLAGILCVCLSACGGRSAYDKGELETKGIFRFEELLFDTPPEELAVALKNSGYRGTMINIAPEDPQYMQQVAGFVADTVIRYTYECVKEEYGDLGWLEESLTKALDKAHGLDDDVRITQVSTMITGQYDYDQRVVCADTEMVIGLDVYVMPQMRKYAYFNNPMYLVNLCKKEYILPDCMTAVARNLVRMPESSKITLLDRMIMEGKATYMVDQCLGGVADTLKLRYTAQQLEWIEDNEAAVWAYMLKEKLLFEADANKYHNLVDEAPKTNAFGESSAPRCAQYIGWRIVESYMKNQKCSLKELMENTDSQQILRESMYKPK